MVLKKIAILGILPICLMAGEVQIGHGNFKMTGGFLGLDSTISADVTTYSMVEQHKNLFSTNFFYKYNITWYDAKKLTQGQNNVNNSVGMFNTAAGQTVLPSMDYRPQGLDVNLVFGRDVLHKDENNFIGMGVMLGVSLPWIDSKKSSSNNDNNNNTTKNAIALVKDTKTTILTYKIGPNIVAMKSLGQYFSVYASATYAYQTGKIKNDYLQSDLNVNGIFQEYDAGVKFQPISYDYKIGWITISPRLYATLGYRYTDWKLDNVKLKVANVPGNFPETDFKMNASIGYFGIGYSF